jgi:hypothetical protein
VIRDHSHLDLLSDEPGWMSETYIGPPPDMDEPDLDDEPTSVFARIDAEPPTIVCPVPPPVRADRRQDPNVMYPCGRTYREHKQEVADAILRGAGYEVIEPIHDDAHGTHLGQATCHECRSTFTWDLPGHSPRSAR